MDFRNTHKYGTLQMIQLATEKSHNIMCDEKEDIKQTLTVSADGSCTLSRFSFEKEAQMIRMTEKQSFTLADETVKSVFEEIVFFLLDEEEKPSDTPDIGTWEMVLTNTDGNIFIFRGTTLSAAVNNTAKYSCRLREVIGINDLFLFDGNKKRLSRLEFSYKSILRTVSEGHHFQSLETLVIDAENDELQYECRETDGIRLKTEISEKNIIGALLWNYDYDTMSIVRGNPDDAMYDAETTRTYTIVLTAQDGSVREFSGTYDKFGLPVCWQKFLSAVSDYLSRNGSGDMFDRRLYMKQIARRSDYIFCYVTFGYDGKPYCYLARDNSYSEGDFVVVPVGADNRETVVRISSILYCSEEDAPYPIRKTKYILRKYDEDSDYELPGASELMLD